MKKIISYETACAKLGIDPKKLPTTKGMDKDDAILTITQHQLIKIRKAIVGKWKANYNDPNQYKWFPVFIWDAAAGAFRFDFAYFVGTLAFAGCGARHVFETEEQAIYFGEKFIDKHNIILIEP